MQGAAGSGIGLGTKSLVVRSTAGAGSGSKRLLASVVDSKLDLLSSDVPRVAEANVTYPVISGGFGHGALHQDGQGIEVAGMPNTTDATQTPVNLTMNSPITVTVCVVGVLEYV